MPPNLRHLEGELPESVRLAQSKGKFLAKKAIADTPIEIPSVVETITGAHARGLEKVNAGVQLEPEGLFARAMKAILNC